MNAPSGLDKAGKKFWRTIVRGWQLDQHQPEILWQACRCLDTIARAEADMKATGPVMVDRFGQSKPHPAVAIIRDYRTLFARLVRELALDAGAEPVRPPALSHRYRR